MARRSTLLVGLGAAAAVGAIVATRRAVKRWAMVEGATGGRPLSLPDGEDRVVESADGAKIEVRLAGPETAPNPVVLVHGWTNDRRVWGAVADRLLDNGHRVVLVNQRGHGGSTGGDDGYTLDAIGNDVRAVLEQLDLHDAVLVGHSMGGMASMAFLTQHRDARHRVAAVALVATAAAGVGVNGGPLGERIATHVISHPRLERVLESGSIGPVLVRNTVGRTAAGSHLDAVRELFVATPPEVRAGFLGAMTQMDLAAALSELDVRAVVIVGSRDRLTPPRLSKRLAAELPGARLVVLPDHGHMLPIEAPAELAAELEQLLAMLGVVEVEPAAGVPG
jgi:pimeloyl-ACP methyl ester carboxylesterase